MIAASAAAILDTFISGAMLLGLAAVAWFFRQWSKGVSDKVDGVAESHTRLDDKVDESLQRTSRIEGALGLPPWHPQGPPAGGWPTWSGPIPLRRRPGG